MATFELGISSATVALFYPEFESYSQGKKQIRDDHRTKTGKLFQYKYGDYSMINMDVNYLPASDAALVNSWWDTNTDLLLFVTSDSVTEVFSVHIMNTETPLSSYNKPYDNLFKGVVKLEGY